MNKRFSFAIDRLMRKLMVLERYEKLCCGVTMSQCYIIEILYNKSFLTMNELSRELGLAASTITRILDILFRDSIITRNRSLKDRRKVRIELTAKGNELAQKIKICSDSYTREILNNIPKGKRREVVECLEILNDAIETLKNKCCN